jgi:hypothetical protein
VSVAAHPRGRPYPKLPLWHTIRLSYSSYFDHFTDALRASWLWLVVVTPPTGVASWQQWAMMRTLVADSKRGMPPPMPLPPFDATLLGNLDTLLLLFASASIAVAWHRLVILEEPPGFSGGNVATGILWRYIGVGLAMILAVMLPVALILAPLIYFVYPFKAGAAAPPTGFFFLIPLGVLVYAVGAAMMFRLCLLLPARAAGDLDLTFKQTWHRTRGNIWRMFWGVTACTIAPLALLQLASLVTMGIPTTAKLADEDFVAQMTTNSMVFAVCCLLMLPIGIGFLSHAYRHFFRRGLAPIGSTTLADAMR